METAINWQFEDDQGISPIPYSLLNFEILCDVTPGEKMVRYYPDGSGYPGSPAEVEVTDCRLVLIIDDNDQKVKPSPEQVKIVGDWFRNYIRANDDLYTRIREEVLEYEREAADERKAWSRNRNYHENKNVKSDVVDFIANMLTDDPDILS